MKKLIIFLFLFVSAVAFGQNSTTYDKYMGYTTSWYLWDYTKSSDNNINTTDSTWTYTIYKDSYKPLKYDVYLSLDSVSGAPEVVTVTLKAKKWLSDASWTTLNTASWTNGSDTVISFTESSTARQYQYFQANLAGANNTFVAKILKFYTKFWE